MLTMLCIFDNSMASYRTCLGAEVAQNKNMTKEAAEAVG